MSVRLKFLIPMVIIAVLAALAILISNILQFSTFVTSTIDVSLDRAVLVMVNETESLQSKARLASLCFSADPAIVAAMESGDSEALLTRAAKLFEETDVELFTITDKKGKVLSRLHAPEVYEGVTMMSCIQSALSGKSATTLEGDMTTNMAACAGVPIQSGQGGLLGALGVGFRIDTKEFVDKIKLISGCEATVFSGDERVATTLPSEDGARAVGTKAPVYISHTVLAGQCYGGTTKTVGKDITIRYIPIMNTGGRAIGMLGVGHYLTKKTDTILSFITIGLFSMGILLCVCVLITLLITERITGPIKRMLDKVHYDALTGIYNRRFFDENMERVIKSLSRSSGMLSLIMIDIDYFKKYNDAYGHHQGDHCLKIVSQALVKSVMRADDFAARYGGEEFAVVLPGTNEGGARVIADRLLTNVRDCEIPHKKSDAAGYVTISVGVTTGAVAHTQSAADYVKRADELLYLSKQNGRNRYTFGLLEG